MQKQCTKCNTHKLLSFFSKRKDSIDGYRHICKECGYKTMADYRAKNQSIINEKNRYKYHNNIEVRINTYNRNVKNRKQLSEQQLKDKKEAIRQYDKLNPDKKNARRAKRRAAELNRTVPWANTLLMSKFYQLAKYLTEQTGILHHVDHIVPLQGKFVSGFHIESNLQVIPASVNLAKSNNIEYGISGLCPAGDYIHYN